MKKYVFTLMAGPSVVAIRAEREDGFVTTVKVHGSGRSDLEFVPPDDQVAVWDAFEMECGTNDQLVDQFLAGMEKING